MGLFHIIILGFSIILVLTSAISGFMGYSRTDDTAAKNMLLAASLMSVLTGALLGLAIFLLHRQPKSFFGHGSLVFAGILMLISGIMYSVTAYRISKTTKAALVSTFSSWGAFLIIVATIVISTFFVKPINISGAPRIKPQQSPSYTEIGGASEQLSELQIASGIGPPGVASAAIVAGVV